MSESRWSAVTRHLGVSGPLVVIFSLVVLAGSDWKVDATTIGIIALVAAAGLLTPALASGLNRRVLRQGWEPALLPGERILYESSADVYTSAQRGWLFLTDRRLLHHVLRGADTEWSLPLDQVADARVGREAGIIASLLTVAARDGHAYTFKIEGAGEWVRRIEAARRAHELSPSTESHHP
ncbi:MAG TPA: hypothetical protein VFQ45_17075 [Longimicrobium sp.]|nr:hypothetical protein [Longimicrobium sp.]